MLRDGIIPRPINGLLEYVVGVVLIIAPFVLNYEAAAAIAASIVVGVLMIAIAASTEGPTSVSNGLKVELHVIIAYLLSALLIASPFIFSFSNEGPATACFIGVGVVLLLLTIGTRFKTGPT